MLKSIYNGIYNSIFFTCVHNNKILNINTLLIFLFRKKKLNAFKSLWTLIEIGKIYLGLNIAIKN